ncbi:hypothetical protein TPR58_15120 [Sphingomonas sp. HF-S3]|uniref:SH3 domain-containing protein n=1 Tax=Sphingomonas rustica TaxID=3103142 RepID=A0ABV0BCL6_9SPHN
MIRLAALLLALAPAPAAAQLIDDIDSAWLAKVRPGPRQHFSGTAEEGPGKRRTESVAAGDLLVAIRTRDRFTLVLHVGKSRRVTSGWIDSRSLARVEPPSPAPSAWLGGWTAWEGRIDITRTTDPAALHAVGYATWGAHRKEAVKLGVNYGEFDVAIRPADGKVAFSPMAGCDITLRLLGPYLIGRDNYGCGGHNVTFGGVYRR